MIRVLERKLMCTLGHKKGDRMREKKGMERTEMYRKAMKKR